MTLASHIFLNCRTSLISSVGSLVFLSVLSVLSVLPLPSVGFEAFVIFGGIVRNEVYRGEEIERERQRRDQRPYLIVEAVSVERVQRSRVRRLRRCAYRFRNSRNQTKSVRYLKVKAKKRSELLREERSSVQPTYIGKFLSTQRTRGKTNVPTKIIFCFSVR
jgi:hypothetical protein